MFYLEIILLVLINVICKYTLINYIYIYYIYELEFNLNLAASFSIVHIISSNLAFGSTQLVFILFLIKSYNIHIHLLLPLLL